LELLGDPERIHTGVGNSQCSAIQEHSEKEEEEEEMVKKQ